jgi:hypothetical protein
MARFPVMKVGSREEMESLFNFVSQVKTMGANV